MIRLDSVRADGEHHAEQQRAKETILRPVICALILANVAETEMRLRSY